MTHARNISHKQMNRELSAFKNKRSTIEKSAHVVFMVYLHIPLPLPLTLVKSIDSHLN